LAVYAQVTQHLLIATNQADGAGLLEDWRWLIVGSCRLLAVTRMGDAFVEKADGEVVFLDTLEGCLKHAAPNATVFADYLANERFDPTWFNADMVALLEEKGKHLGPGQCYSYRVPPILGGSFFSENIHIASVLVHFSIMGQLHEQTRNLPPSSKISGFSIGN
jgi:hypothetical protein